jgi:hypothetical protein
LPEEYIKPSSFSEINVNLLNMSEKDKKNIELIRRVNSRDFQNGGKVPNIPTWNYPSKGTPIYRDTTEVPPNTFAAGGPNTFAAGGFMSQQENKTPFEHMIDSRSNNSKVVQEDLEAEVYKGPKLYEEGLETPHMEFTARMLADEEGDPDKKKKRLEENKRHLTHRGGVQKETMSFYNELVSIFPELRVTSGKRTGTKGAGKSGNKSRHVKGEAIDIGKEHSDIYYFLMNTEEGLALLDKYNMGILDETNPKILSKTLSKKQQGSGSEADLLKHAHFHIGMDNTIAPLAKARLKELRETGSITKLRAYIDKNPEHKKVVNVLTEEQKVSITLLPESKRKNLLDKIQ